MYDFIFTQILLMSLNSRGNFVVQEPLPVEFTFLRVYIPLVKTKRVVGIFL